MHPSADGTHFPSSIIYASGSYSHWLTGCPPTSQPFLCISCVRTVLWPSGSVTEATMAIQTVHQLPVGVTQHCSVPLLLSISVGSPITVLCAIHMRETLRGGRNTYKNLWQDPYKKQKSKRDWQTGHTAVDTQTTLFLLGNLAKHEVGFEARLWYLGY